MSTMAEIADAAIATLTASSVGAAGALGRGRSRSEDSGEPRRKKNRNRWDDEPPLTIGGVPVEVANLPQPRHMTDASFFGFVTGGEVTKKISIPLNAEGCIIGKGGEQINKMRSESQAKVNVKHQEGDEASTVTLQGSKAQVEHAEVLIFECLKSGRLKDGEHRIIDVPQNCIGETIGHSGCYLQQMSEQSGCNMKFSHAVEFDPNAEPGKQVCVIRGPPEKINMAEMLLNERIAEVQQKHISKQMKVQQEEVRQRKGGKKGDWNCPNPECKNHKDNVVFANKRHCPLCGSENPAPPEAGRQKGGRSCKGDSCQGGEDFYQQHAWQQDCQNQFWQMFQAMWGSWGYPQKGYQTGGFQKGGWHKGGYQKGGYQKGGYSQNHQPEGW